MERGVHILNVLLVGEESAGAQVLKLLASGPHRLVGVVAASGKNTSWGLTVHQLAEQMGIRTWPTTILKDPDFARLLCELKVDLLLNVHSLCVIDAQIVASPLHGSFNVHPGPLPRYAGLNAPSWAIYHGETTHGVTLHRMAAGIDTGPIVYQVPVDIEETDTGFSLSAKCIEYEMGLIRRLLQTAALDPAAIPSIAQDLAQRQYFGKETPHDGWVAWSRPAREIFDMARAADYSPFLSPWKQPRSRLGNREIGFAKLILTGRSCDAPPGTVGDVNQRSVLIASADEWVESEWVTIAGRRMHARELLEPGDRLEWNQRFPSTANAGATHDQ
jgi:UDP-4-amino-4-deoxy-L-arabinose formyltransferase/UDP-glucuronic acid dehydrogenase (UDP-4-keto-hexauronic acid decarboxylating)